MKIKTSELTGAALDWAVAKCEDVPVVFGLWRTLWVADTAAYVEGDGGKAWFPATDWSQGGPIIDREKICILPPVIKRIGPAGYPFPIKYWRAMRQTDEDRLATHGKGYTPLIAAMRCYCASKLGDEVEVPEELK